MKNKFDSKENYLLSEKKIGYVPRKEAGEEVYEKLGFMCGLEVHQQLKTEKKLFCRCPAGKFQKKGQYEAEIIRHMRPTLSEMGGYDGTALMEFKTRKSITYRIANITTCTYDVDDTPPFKVNQQALDIALEVALLLKTNIVGELHITRKQYLDGSIPAGFQRTGIISIEGSIPLKNKTVGIIQLSMEEDSCREISDVGHERMYTTDRLGMPLIETVTYPDMKTPEEAAEAAQYIRFLNRSTGKVRTGIGAAREDVNVSITGGTRVEIKGVSHIKLIPELVHNEAFRQKSFLVIKEELLKRVKNPEEWGISYKRLEEQEIHNLEANMKKEIRKGFVPVAVNLPSFEGILSFFTQPGRTFGDEISDRLKVIACIEKPNMTYGEDFRTYSLDENQEKSWESIRTLVEGKDEDSQILLWGLEEDLKTALDTIEERCQMAFQGVPNETRKSLPNGTTIFERVLPGADRMYPDTDSAPISITQERIDKIREKLPVSVHLRQQQLKTWGVPEDAHTYLLKKNLVPLIDQMEKELEVDPKVASILLAHRLKYLEGHYTPDSTFQSDCIYRLFEFKEKNNVKNEDLKKMLDLLYKHPKMDLQSNYEISVLKEGGAK